MKKLCYKIILLTFSIVLISCVNEKEKEKDLDIVSSIVYGRLDEDLKMEQETSVLANSENTVSQHIDSIIKGHLNTRIISTGEKKFDLNNDGVFDIGFEIIDLRDFNGKDFPSYFDTLAARVIPYTVEISDNSTYGYCSAFDEDGDIKKDEYWGDRENYVLGTFANAGQFQGEGIKYLGFRFNESSYGWLKLTCSSSSNELVFYEYAYNKNGAIRAGQK
jgi:hypothetical protein